MPKNKKNQKQRKRRYKARNGVPYYGSWWAGVTNPESVHDSEHFHSGGGTTQNSTGGDFGGGGGGMTAKLAATEPIATIARVSYSAWPPSGSVNGTGILENQGYDPVSGDEVAVVNLKGEKTYVPPDSVVSCPIYNQFNGGSFDEIAMIVIGGNDSFVWWSDYENGNGFLPSHQEVAEVLLGIQGVGIYDITTAVLKFDGTFKIFAGDMELSDENVEMLLRLIEGANVKNIQWNGENVRNITAKLSILSDSIQQYSISETPPPENHRFLIYEGRGFFWDQRSRFIHADLCLELAEEQGKDFHDIWTSPTFVCGYKKGDDQPFLYIYAEEEPLTPEFLNLCKPFYPDVPEYTVSHNVYFSMPGFPGFEEDHGITASIRDQRR